MYLKQHPDIVESCGLDATIPDRRTIDRRFCNLDLSRIIGDIGKHFIKTGLVESKTAAVDSTLAPAAGHVWHSKDKARNHTPIWY